jgi:hypothetical protein
MDRSRLGRGLAILAVAALAMAIVSPAFSAAPLTKAKVKKIAKKQINKLVPKMIDAATIDQGTIPPVTASTTDPNKTVFTEGPFTISLDCSLSGSDVNLALLVKTTEENSFVNDGYTGVGDLDPGDGDETIADYTGNPPGDEAYNGANLYYEYASFRSPSRTHFYAQFDTVTNFQGNHCYVDGWFLDLAG